MDDKLKGIGEELKGKAKEEIGRVAGDRSTEWSGKAEQVKGKIDQKIGDVKNTGADAEHDAVRRDREELPPR